MLKETGAKFIGRSLCLWGGEGELLRNLERARQQVPKVHAADPEMILQAVIRGATRPLPFEYLKRDRADDPER